MRADMSDLYEGDSQLRFLAILVTSNGQMPGLLLKFGQS